MYMVDKLGNISLLGWTLKWLEKDYEILSGPRRENTKCPKALPSCLLGFAASLWNPDIPNLTVQCKSLTGPAEQPKQSLRGPRL